MFFGEHTHSLDGKGRVILPAKYRGRLADGVVATSAVDGCLAVWAPDDFEVRAREMQDKAKSGSRAERDQARAFFSGTVEVVPGPQGRVALPAHLREFAGLHDEVVITGQFDHIEIWDAERWRQRKQAGEQGLAAGADV